MNDPIEHLICLACATELPRALAEVGSLCCHDCADAGVPLSDLVFHLQRHVVGGAALPEAA